MDGLRPCPDAALLAAFIDGGLAEFERTAVVSHLIDCRECRAVALTVVELREVPASEGVWRRGGVLPSSPPFESRQTWWARQKTRAPAAGVLSAVLLAVAAASFYSLPAPDPAVASLVDAAEGQRLADARLSGGFTYAARRSPVDLRSADTPSRWQLISAAGHLRRNFARDDSTESRRAVGLAALVTGEYDDAVANLSVALAERPADVQAANDLAAALYERSMAGMRPDDLPAALAAVDRALLLKPAYAEALFNRALVITSLGLQPEARKAWQAFLAVDSRSPWAVEARERAAALHPGSVTTDEREALTARLARGDDVANALIRAHASHARRLFDTTLLPQLTAAVGADDDGRRAAVLTQMRAVGAAFARVTGEQFPAAVLASFDRAGASGRARQVEWAAAHDLFAQGMALMTETRFADAAPVLDRAAARLAAVGSPFALWARVEGAATEYYAGRPASAAAVLAAVRRPAQSNGFQMLVVRAAWLHGMVAFGQHDYARVRRAYEEMRDLSATGGDVDMQVTSSVLLANLHWMLGDRSEAWRYRVEAASRLDDVQNVTTRTNFFLSAAGDALSSGHHAAAELYESALLAQPGLTDNALAQAHAQAARTLEALGRGDDAHAALVRARQRLAAIADAASRGRIETDVLAAEAAVFLRSNPAAAVAAAERALTLPLAQREPLRRARLHLALAEAAIADAQWDRAESAIAAGLESFEAFRRSPSARLALRASEQAWTLYTKGVEVALRQGDAHRAFAYSERRRADLLASGAGPALAVTSLDEVQRRIPANTALAMFTQVGDHLQIWVVSARGVVAQTVAMHPDRAAALVSAHLSEIAGHAPPVSSARLFDSVIRPVAAALADFERVAVVADAPYSRIAYAALWDRRRDRFLIEDHAVAVSPSASAFVRAIAAGTPPVRRAGRRAALVQLPALADARSPAPTLPRDLSAVYGAGVRARVTPTAAHVLDEAGASDVVHLTASIVPNPEFPVLSRLRLADEPGRRYSGDVFAHQVSARALRTNLVALDVSVSSREDLGATGPLVIARAFLAAGVATVVSPISNAPAAALDRTWLEFHRQYAAGTAAAESLRRAQLAALRESNRRVGPWATLIVFGSTQ